MLDRISVFEASRLPPAFGAALLIFLLVLALSPYLAGYDFGVFKVPTFGQGLQRALKIMGPILFLGCVLLFVPVFPSTSSVPTPSATPTPVMSPNPTPLVTPQPTPLASPTPNSIDFVLKVLENYRRAFSMGFKTRFAETEEFPLVRASIKECYTNLHRQYLQAAAFYPNLKDAIRSLRDHAAAMDRRLTAMERYMSHTGPGDYRLDGSSAAELTQPFKELEDHRIAYIQEMKTLAKRFNIQLEDIPEDEIRSSTFSYDRLKQLARSKPSPSPSP